VPAELPSDLFEIGAHLPAGSRLCLIASPPPTPAANLPIGVEADQPAFAKTPTAPSRWCRRSGLAPAPHRRTPRWHRGSRNAVFKIIRVTHEPDCRGSRVPTDVLMTAGKRNGVVQRLPLTSRSASAGCGKLQSIEAGG